MKASNKVLSDNYYDVIIVGGSIVGSALAINLSTNNSQLNIAVIEKNTCDPVEDKPFSGRTYAISPKNINYLKEMSSWPNADLACGIQTMNILGDKGGNIVLTSKLVKHEYLAQVVEGNKIQKLLKDKLTKLSNVKLINATLKDIEEFEQHVKLGTTEGDYLAGLVVGADGVNSVVRTKIGIKSKLIKYSQDGVIANFACELPHNNTAYQWFLDNGILAYLPLPNNHISIVWATNDKEKLLSLDEKDFSEMVAKASKYKLGKLTLIDKYKSFPLQLFITDKFFSNRIVLIGDAAHNLHPLAGQGLNLGLGDARCLANIISKYKTHKLADTAILNKYNAKRIPEVRQMQLVCHSLYKLFSSDFPLVSLARNFGLNLFNSTSLIKKYLIKAAITY